MNALYLLLGGEGALADRAMKKLSAQLTEERAEVTTLLAGDVIPGDIADALAPSLFSERRALVIKDLQDLDDECKPEITRLDIDHKLSLQNLLILKTGDIKSHVSFAIQLAIKGRMFHTQVGFLTSDFDIGIGLNP